MMMKRYLIYLIAMGFVLALPACEKVNIPDPADVPGSAPVFYSDFTFDGVDFKTEAGINDYIMDASFRRDTALGVIDLISYLHPLTHLDIISEGNIY